MSSEPPKSKAFPKGVPKGKVITWRGRTWTAAEWRRLQHEFAHREVTDKQLREYIKREKGQP